MGVIRPMFPNLADFHPFSFARLEKRLLVK